MELTTDHKRCPECEEWHLVGGHYESHMLYHILVAFKRLNKIAEGEEPCETK